MSFEIRLDNFSGPLDLLLHLIKSNEMDICDIRIFEITEQYLSVIERMKQLDLEVAGEFLLMAATLIHIKSRLLLPASEEIVEEEGEDPRAELVQRLLEYQRYKDAASRFEQLPRLQRDIFTVPARALETGGEDDSLDMPLDIGIYQLTQAFHHLLEQRPVETFHEVVQESLSVADYSEWILQRLVGQQRLALHDLVADQTGREELIVTFLALLELVKMRCIMVEQMNSFSEIWLIPALPPDQLTGTPIQRQALSYE